MSNTPTVEQIPLHLQAAFVKFLTLTEDPTRLNLLLNRLLFEAAAHRQHVHVNEDELSDLQALCELLIQCQNRN